MMDPVTIPLILAAQGALHDLRVVGAISAVDAVTDGNDATYLSLRALGGIAAQGSHSFTVTADASGASGIQAVTVTPRVFRIAAGPPPILTARALLYRSGEAVELATEIELDTMAIVEIPFSWDLNPWTGLAWAKSDLVGLEVGVKLTLAADTPAGPAVAASEISAEALGDPLLGRVEFSGSGRVELSGAGRIESGAADV